MIGIGVSLALLLAPALAASAPPPYPGYRYCSKFTHQLGGDPFDYFVYKRDVSCDHARAIVREFILGPRSRKKIVNGGADTGDT
jgi:hypothetical protein